MKINSLILSLLLIFSLEAGFAKSAEKKTGSEPKKKTYAVKFKVFPADYSLEIDGDPAKLTNLPNYLKKIDLREGTHTFHFSAKGYQDKEIELKVGKNLLIEEKLERKDSVLVLQKELKTGIQPKSVEFTPDGKYFLSALLLDNGIDVFSAETLQKVRRLELPKHYAQKAGFVELAFVNRLNEIWVSQMTTNSIHVFNLSDFSYKMTFSTKGLWSKVILISDDEKMAFVSNWSSEDVSIINVDRHESIKRVKMSGIPRGMATTADQKHLYVAIFNKGGMVEKINLQNYKIEKKIQFQHGCMRHIVVDRKKDLYYVSDMGKGSIYLISGENDKVIREIKVDKKINTIKLTADGRYLFASSRGPNNPVSYLEKGFVFGKVFVIDTEKQETVYWLWGRNQPTGLALSPDDKIMVFSDFLDHNLEVYKTNLSQLKGFKQEVAVH